MSQVSIYNTKGEVAQKADLNADIFGFSPNPGVVSEVVSMYIANMKTHTASVKSKGEVSGGGRKPFRQKGTGRARAGSIRSPIYRGGGTVFGPQPRKIVYRIPDKKKKIALKSVLSLKLKEDKLKIVQDIKLKDGKTKSFGNILKALKIDNAKKVNKTLIVMDSPSKDILKAANNIPNVRLRNPLVLNALDVISADWLVIESNTLPLLNKRVA